MGKTDLEKMISEQSSAALYDKLKSQKSPSNFSNIQASRTINRILKDDILENIHYFILRYFSENNPQTNIYGKSREKTILPYGGECKTQKGPKYNLESFPKDLQDLIKNYLLTLAD